MGDMAEVFNDLRKAKQEQRAKRAEVNVEALQVLGVDAKEQSKNVFRIDAEYGTVMYYPSSSCWQHRGKIMRGDVQAFKQWLAKQEAAHYG